LEAAERVGSTGPFIDRTRESLAKMRELLLAEAPDADPAVEAGESPDDDRELAPPPGPGVPRSERPPAPEPPRSSGGQPRPGAPGADLPHARRLASSERRSRLACMESWYSASELAQIKAYHAPHYVWAVAGPLYGFCVLAAAMRWAVPPVFRASEVAAARLGA